MKKIYFCKTCETKQTTVIFLYKSGMIEVIDKDEVVLSNKDTLEKEVMCTVCFAIIS